MYIHNILQTKKKHRLSQKMGHNKNRKKNSNSFYYTEHISEKLFRGTW